MYIKNIIKYIGLLYEESYMTKEIKIGWYFIGEELDLYIDGELKNVYVEYIHIESKTSNDDYKVTHYDLMSNEITTLSLTKDDILPKIDGKKCKENPDFI